MTDFVLEKNAVVRGLCPHDCPDTCALLTTVENGRAVKVQGNPDHLHTQGVLCTKVSRYTERTYSPQRLTHPLKRVGPKGLGQFCEASMYAPAITNVIIPDAVKAKIDFTPEQSARLQNVDYAYQAKNMANWLERWNKEFKG